MASLRIIFFLPIRRHATRKTNSPTAAILIISHRSVAIEKEKRDGPTVLWPFIFLCHTSNDHEGPLIPCPTLSSLSLSYVYMHVVWSDGNSIPTWTSVSLYFSLSFYSLGFFKERETTNIFIQKYKYKERERDTRIDQDKSGCLTSFGE